MKKHFLFIAVLFIYMAGIAGMSFCPVTAWKIVGALGGVPFLGFMLYSTYKDFKKERSFRKYLDRIHDIPEMSSQFETKAIAFTVGERGEE